MKFYLMNWRREIFDWKFKENVMFWSTGNSHKPSKGDFAFLIKLGKAPRGLVAIARIESEVQEMDWNFKTKRGPGVKIKFVEKRPPEDECVVPIEYLKNRFPAVNWSSQNCISVPDSCVIEILVSWGRRVQNAEGKTS